MLNSSSFLERISSAFDFDSRDAGHNKLVVPDAHLLFSGHFDGAGSDLVISAPSRSGAPLL
jgi:hypothetical protein